MVWVAARVRCLQIRLIQRMWKKDDLQTVEIWDSRVRALSKTTPRFQVDRAGLMLALPIWMLARGGVLRNLEWIGRNSVLSSLSFRVEKHPAPNISDACLQLFDGVREKGRV